MTDTSQTEQLGGTAQERIEFALKLLGASAILTALMGWPAVSVQFAAYGIPADLIEIRAAVRAGILPALVFVLVFGYAIWLRRYVTRLPDYGPLQGPLLAFLYVQSFLLFLPSFLVRLGGLFAVAFLGLQWAAESLGVAVAGVGWLVGFGVPSTIFAVAAFFGWDWFLNRAPDEVPDDVDAGEKLEGLPDQAEARSNLFFARLVFADYISLLLHAAALALNAAWVQTIWPGGFAWLTVPSALFLGAVLTVFSAQFPIVTAVRFGMSGIFLGNLLAMRGFLLLSAGLAILFFSTDLYQRLPKEWGGGRPAPVSVLLYADKAPPLDGWPVATEGAHVRLAPVYLLELEGDHLILADRNVPPGRWIAVPQAAVVLVAGP